MSTNTKTKMSVKWHDDLFAGVTVGDEAISRGWDDFYTRFSDDEAKEDKKAENPQRALLERIQRQLARTANVVRNASADDVDSEEKALSIEFSNGDAKKVNSPSSRTIYLNPDKFLNPAKGKSELPLIEAETGKALIAQAMKRTCSKASWNKAKSAGKADPRSKATNALWEAVEMAVARGEVLKDWPGFLPYFLRHAQETGATRDQVQAYIDGSDEKPTSEVCSTAIAWNLLNPNNKVKLPPIYDRACIEASRSVIKAGPARTKRYDYCAEAMEAMQRVLDEDWAALPPPPPPGPGEDDESGDKDDDCKGKSESEAKGKGEDGKGDDGEKGEEEKEEKEEKEGGGDSGGGDPVASDPSAEEKPEPSKKDADESPDPEDKEEEAKAEDPGKSKPGGGVGSHLAPPTMVDNELFGGETPYTPEDDLPEAQDVDEVEDERDPELPSGIRKPNHIVVSTYQTDDGSGYLKEVAKVRPAIIAITSALRFRNNDATQMSRGHVSGDLDDGSLHKLALRGEENPTIWERREVVATPSIAVCLLVDESGSMSSGDRYKKARSVAVAMAEALSQIKGINLMVLGHTANCSAGDRYLSSKGSSQPSRVTVDGKAATEARPDGDLIISEYLTKQHRNRFALKGISANANNLDGFAMEYAARRVAADYPGAKSKLVFVISDGQPAGESGRHSYGGREAAKHMNQVCLAAKRNLGVDIYGVGIDSAYSKKLADEMYGSGRCVVIKDVAGSIPILTSFLRQIANNV